MKTLDIAEAIAEAIDYKIFTEWRHEGHIEQTLCDGVVVTIDGKTYAIAINEEGNNERAD